MATNTTAARQKRAVARRARAGAAWSKARSAAGSTRTRLGQSTYTCPGCGEALGTASALAGHNCGGKPVGGKPAGGRRQARKAGKQAGKVVPIPSRAAGVASRPAQRGGGTGHPAFTALVKATQAISEIDLTDGNGRAVLDSEEFDTLFLQFGKALSRAGDNLGVFADRLDRELNLDRRVTRPAHDLADAIGSDARECAKDVRKKLRSVYASELQPGSRGPAAGFLP